MAGLYAGLCEAVVQPKPSRRTLLVGAGIAVAGLKELTATNPGESQQPPDSPLHLHGTDHRPPYIDPFGVVVAIDAAQTIGDMTPIWRFFGADEPNYAAMEHGKRLVSDLGALSPKHVYFRAHNLLTSGDGTPALKWGSTNAYTEDEQGNPVYDWTILDKIFDTYISRGVRPYVEIGFMPKALSIRPEPYQHHWTPTARYEEIYTGWAYPPKDYAKWAELVYQWVGHCVKRYGATETMTWYWEVWNEANIGYWRGTPEEFRKLHDYAIDAVRRALPAAKVGGSDVAGAGGKFQSDFLEHCLRETNHATGKIGTPLDFVSFHAKGAPTFIEGSSGSVGHVRMGIAAQLRTIDAGFSLIKSYPELRRTPIVIGESDPDGCAACQGPQLGYRNNMMYSSYTAACFARKYLLADRHDVNLLGALTWAFEFENQPLFAGFRALATGGIALPVLNVFRMFSKMGVGKRVKAESSGQVSLDAILKGGVRGDTADVGVLAAVDNSVLAILIWHYHDDDIAGSPALVELTCENLPEEMAGDMRMRHWRIDADHSNSYATWLKMGSPVKPTSRQYAQLQKASRLTPLCGTPGATRVENGKALVQFELPRQAVSLMVIG